MTKYVLKRLLYMVIVFLLVSLLMYSIYNLIPTDPARAQLEPMKTSLKPAEYEQRYQMLRQQMGLNDPLIVRYLRWIGFWPDVNGELNGMLQGNFGYSQIYKTDVANVLPSRMLNTIYINIFSTLVALAITIPLGIYCAVHKRSKTDNAVQVLSIVGYSIPVYIIALIFIWLFAVTLRWLPVFGMQTPGNNFTGFRAFLDKVYYMTLPVLVMTVGSLGGMTRGTVIELAKKLGIELLETPVTRFDIWTADECFLTGTAAKLIPLVELDKRVIGNGKPGEITKRLIEAFNEVAPKIGVHI